MKTSKWVNTSYRHLTWGQEQTLTVLLRCIKGYELPLIKWFPEQNVALPTLLRLNIVLVSHLPN